MRESLESSVRRHLGRPYHAAGFDCWEFVRAIYSDAFGITLPALLHEDYRPAAIERIIAGQLAGSAWSKLPGPVDGCVVVLGRRDWPHHAGVYLSDGDRCAHNLEGVGVRCDYLARMRASGWGFVAFYAYSEPPCPSVS